MNSKITRTIAAFLAAIMLITCAPFAGFQTEAEAAGAKYLKATGDDFKELEKFLQICSFDAIFEVGWQGNVPASAYKGMTFKKNDKALTKAVMEEFLDYCYQNPNLISGVKKYNAGVRPDPLKKYIADPNDNMYGMYGLVSDYYKIPAKEVDRILENQFGITVYHNTKMLSAYYYNGYYYYCIPFDPPSPELNKISLKNNKRLNDGSYLAEFKFNHYYSQQDATHWNTSGIATANVRLKTVNGKRCWQITKLQRVKSIIDAYQTIIWNNIGGNYFVYDIDKDGTSELVVTDIYDNVNAVYTYNGKNAVELSDSGYWRLGEHGTYGSNSLKGIFTYDRIYIEQGLVLERINRYTKVKNELQFKELQDKDHNYVSDMKLLTVSPCYEASALLSAREKIGATAKIAVKQSAAAIKLSWKAVQWASGYRVYLYNTKTKKYQKLGDTTKTSYTVKKLKPGTVYKFAVKAYGKDGKATIWSPKLKTVTASTKPAAPKLTVKAGAKKAALKWDKQVCTGYQIYYSAKKNGTYKKLATVKSAKTVSYTAKKLKKGQSAYFKVRAYRKVGSANVFGAFSAVKGVKIK